MKLWVGLGNPEPGMLRNRHNIGFMAVDTIAAVHGFAAWRRQFRGLTADGRVGNERILLLKPLTYMNDSGLAVQAAAAFHKLEAPAITVFHDELDLVPGKARVKQGGGAAGHNGLRSIDHMLGSPEYWRVRLGIGHPGDKALVHSWVLSNFTRDDEDWLADLLGDVAEAAPLLAAGTAEAFMSRLALRRQESE